MIKHCLVVLFLFSVVVTTLAAYDWQQTSPYNPPDFEAFFPDKSGGGRKLDKLWNDNNKDDRSDKEILETVKLGLRKTTQHRTLILRWIGNKYIWGKTEQHPAAIEIMYHAADFRPEIQKKYRTRHYAVYFGLSVVKEKTPSILRSLTELCMEIDDPNDLGRVAWGCKSQMDELLVCLKPYLDSDDPKLRKKAVVLEKIFTGKIKAFDWAKQQNGEEPLPQRKTIPKAAKSLNLNVNDFNDLLYNLMKNSATAQMKNIDLEAIGKEMLPKVEEATTDEAFALLCQELLAQVQDSHASLLRGTKKPPRPKLPQWDAGFACLKDDRGLPVIYYVAEGGSADSKGLKSGMRVCSINGKSVDKCIAEATLIQSACFGCSTDQYRDYHAYRGFARQMEPQKKIELVVEVKKGRQRTVTLKADLQTKYIPRLPVPLDDINDGGDDVQWTKLKGNIGYIYVRRIRKNLNQKLEEAVDELKYTKGIIIDVRANSGGGFDSKTAHDNFNLTKESNSDITVYEKPMALLIGPRCISAGEGWSSWFIANKRAKAFGLPTAGASGRKTTITLPSGRYKARFVVKPYKGYLDEYIEGKGLQPDVAVIQNAEDLSDGVDTVLEAAREYLLVSD